MDGARLAGRGVEFEAFVAEKVEHAVLTGGEVAGVLILKNARPQGLLVLVRPEMQAVVGVVGFDRPLPLDDEPPADRQRTDGAVVPVDHLARPGIAVPQHSQPARDTSVIADRRVRRVAVLM